MKNAQLVGCYIQSIDNSCTFITCHSSEIYAVEYCRCVMGYVHWIWKEYIWIWPSISINTLLKNVRKISIAHIQPILAIKLDPLLRMKWVSCSHDNYILLRESIRTSWIIFAEVSKDWDSFYQTSNVFY